jgi:tripartite-type tricarboxylate transporter receptor subunit TctC
MTTERSPVLPKLATSREQGLDVQAYTWNAIFLPKGAPENVVKKLHDAAVAAINTPAVKDRLQGLGANLVGPDRQSSAYLGKFVADEIRKWEAPIRKSGVLVE